MISLSISVIKNCDGQAAIRRLYAAYLLKSFAQSGTNFHRVDSLFKAQFTYGFKTKRAFIKAINYCREADLCVMSSEDKYVRHLPQPSGFSVKIEVGLTLGDFVTEVNTVIEQTAAKTTQPDRELLAMVGKSQGALNKEGDSSSVSHRSKPCSLAVIACMQNSLFSLSKAQRVRRKSVADRKRVCYATGLPVQAISSIPNKYGKLFVSKGGDVMISLPSLVSWEGREYSRLR